MATPVENIRRLAEAYGAMNEASGALAAYMQQEDVWNMPSWPLNFLYRRYEAARGRYDTLFAEIMKELA